MAWAAAEAVSATAGQRCVVATHHPLLSAMEGCYAFARSWHLVAECRSGRARQQSSSSSSKPSPPPPLLRFAWRVAPGPCPVRHYGLALAPSVGMPKRVVEAAAAVASAIEGGGGGGEEDEAEEEEEEEKEKHENPTLSSPISLPQAQRSLLEAAHRFRCLAAALSAGADERAVVTALSGLRKEAASALREAEEAGMVVEA